MAKKALVILAQGFEEIEAVTVIDILRRAEVRVTVAGLIGLEVKGSRELIVNADSLLDGVTDDADAYVLPGGGMGATNLAGSEKVAELLKKANSKGKIIAAICAAPAVVLAPLGILDGKNATCYPGMEEDFKSSTTFCEDAVCVDGNIITSRGPATALEFALVVSEKLCGKETADKVRKATLSK